jgi:RNA polymerase sigma-70 factor, ECF subfamily
MSSTENSEQLSDEELMISYQLGDYQAFNTLYLRHKKRVYSYLTKRLKEQESVEEVHQNTFLKLHRCRHQYDSKHPLLKWLYTIARSELLDFCKRKRVPTSLLNEEIAQGIVDPNTTADQQIDLEQIEGLSKKERQALTMRYYSDKDYEEISKLLSVSYPNARKLVSRGIKKLQALFNHSDESKSYKGGSVQ